MYSLESVALDNPTYGWTVQAASRPVGEFAREVVSVAAPMRDGVAAGTVSSFVAPVRTLVVRTPGVNLEALLALLDAGGTLRRSGSSRILPVETLNVTPVELPTVASLFEVTWTYRAPRVFWRDGNMLTPYNTFTVGTTAIDYFEGISAPISDLVVLLTAYLPAGVRFTDSSGAWFEVTQTVGGGNDKVIFYPQTGKAFLHTGAWGTDADIAARSSWAGGTARNDLVRFGGPRRRFELTPRRGANPATRAARVTVTGTGGYTPTLFVRARGAYLTP